MKIVKKNVYYCDFCKKRSLSASAMKKHEKRCTANPDRECRMCAGSVIKDEIEPLKARFTIIENGETGERTVKWTGEPVTLEQVREIADDCPVCTFALLRQTKLNYSCFGFQFDFKKELSEAMAERNREIEYHQYYGTY